MPANIKEWVKSFEIFEKYDGSEGISHAEHDEVYGGPDPDDVSEIDLARLEELGWTPSEYGGSFHTFV